MEQNRMKQKTDQGRSEHQFAEGDQVFLRLQPYKQTSLKTEQCQKLEPKFYGPYTVLKRVGQVCISVSFAQSVEATSCFSCFMLEEGDWSQVPNSNQPSRVS
jgi:hypothetical protein